MKPGTSTTVLDGPRGALTRRAFFALAGSLLLVPKTTIFLPPRGGWPVFTDELGLAIAHYMATLWTPTDFADMKRQVGEIGGMKMPTWKVTAERAAEMTTVELPAAYRMYSTTPDWPPRRR